jgi:hypothetical protein
MVKSEHASVRIQNTLSSSSNERIWKASGAMGV